MEGTKVLIVEDESLIAEDISMALRGFGYSVVGIAASGEEAIQQVKLLVPDLVIMDIILQGSMDGIEAAGIITGNYQTPVIMLTAYADESIVTRAAEQVPHAFLLKPFNSRELHIAVEISLLRHRLEQNLRERNRELKNELLEHRRQERRFEELAMVDELTGVYNRRGFYQLMEQQISLARRSNTSLVLGFFDLDNMKGINDAFGHDEGDRALVSAASVLRRIFRGSDLIARWGGDEFTVLMIEAENSIDGILDRRIRARIDEYNRENGSAYPLSFSWGLVTCDAVTLDDVETVIKRADQNMYARKNGKKVNSEER